MATAILTTVPTGSSSPAPAPPPATAIVARAGGEALPAYVTAEQARAVVDAAETTQRRLLLECLWQSGGRVSEVLRLRRCDVDPAEGALVLENLKQRRRERRRKRVYVSSGLVAQLLAYCRDARLGPTAPLFFSRQSGKVGAPMARQHAWRLVTRYALAAGVRVVRRAGELRPATGLDFRHGAAVHQLRCGVPLSEVSQQLGHARIDTTTIYTRLTNAERRRYADRVAW
jgi:integrase